jgi:hypothetical protein
VQEMDLATSSADRNSANPRRIERIEIPNLAGYLDSAAHIKSCPVQRVKAGGQAGQVVARIATPVPVFIEARIKTKSEIQRTGWCLRHSWRKELYGHEFTQCFLVTVQLA